MERRAVWVNVENCVFSNENKILFCGDFSRFEMDNLNVHVKIWKIINWTSIDGLPHDDEHFTPCGSSSSHCPSHRQTYSHKTIIFIGKITENFTVYYRSFYDFNFSGIHLVIALIKSIVLYILNRFFLVKFDESEKMLTYTARITRLKRMMQRTEEAMLDTNRHLCWQPATPGVVFAPLNTFELEICRHLRCDSSLRFESKEIVLHRPVEEQWESRKYRRTNNDSFLFPNKKSFRRE